jgi:tRNA G18 (ribose-2'-O)-methylase SpoU
VPIRITDPADPRLAEYIGLMGKRIEHPEYCIVESALVIRRLIGSAFAIRSLLLLPEQAERLADVLPLVDAPVYLVDRDVMNATAGFNVHRGALASATRRPLATLDDVVATATRLVVLEGCNDHENLGVIARSARGLGMDGMLLDPSCADPFYRRSLRVSMGELLYLPVARCVDWPTTLTTLRDRGFEVWALTPANDAVDLPDVVRKLSARSGATRIAILLGAEGPGLSDAALAAATRRVRIPMHHGVDSLNIGHAAAIAMAAVASLR